jgi:hypothetical protein
MKPQNTKKTRTSRAKKAAPAIKNNKEIALKIKSGVKAGFFVPSCK